MKSIASFIILAMLFLSCSSIAELSGTYVSKSPNSLNRLSYFLKGCSSYSVGSELSLHKDSTFKLTTCGNIITGNWTYDKDSVYLLYRTNRWRNDSLQEYGYEGRWPQVYSLPVAYKINSRGLYRISESIRENKEWRVIHAFRKIQ